jgi:RES domain-containing protein
MIVYRLSSKKYADDLSGIGAELTGGRWNYKGTRVIYTSDSRALCTAEIAVHTPIGLLPKDYYLIELEIPDSIDFQQITAESLPDNWKEFPHNKTTQQVGEKFVLECEYLFIKVPSAVVPGDYNILINPQHPDFKQVKIKNKVKFDFDQRLFK